MLQAAGQLTIDLNAVRENYRILSKRAPGARCGGVLKADAYGLGMAQVALVLLEEGCHDFFIATPQEGIDLRAVIGREPRIYVLNGYYESYAELYLQSALIPAIGSFMEIDSYRKLGEKAGRPLPAWLNFNTRMNRLGLGEVETRELISDKTRIDGIDVTGVMSHFACADEDHPLNDTQYDVFMEIAGYFPQAEKSLCNSPGIFRSDKYHCDVLRPGMALYGLNPVPQGDNPMRPVVNLKVPVIRRRRVFEGASVGYNASYRFEKDTELATVSAGYADGLLRALSNTGKFFWKGYPCPIRGRVSMDLITLDLSAVPQDELPRPGQFMNVLCSDQSADDLAADAGTIGYEILTALGRRYQRQYVGLASDALPAASQSL